MANWNPSMSRSANPAGNAFGGSGSATGDTTTQESATDTTQSNVTDNFQQQVQNTATNQLAMQNQTTRGSEQAQQLQTALTNAISNTTGRTTTDNTQTTNNVIDNMDPATRNAFTQFLSQLVSGGNTGVNQGMDARTKLLNSIQAQLAAVDPANARSMAEGNIADLTRQLMEQTLPSIVGSQEAAGGSGSALTQLLASDAATRTGEAQQRAILEATLGLSGQAANLSALGLDAANQMDPATVAMLAAIQAGTGSMTTEQGTVTDRGVQETQEQTVSSELANSIMQSLLTSRENLSSVGTQQETGTARATSTGRTASDTVGSTTSSGTTTVPGTTGANSNLANLAALNSVLSPGQLVNLLSPNATATERAALGELTKLFGVQR